VTTLLISCSTTDKEKGLFDDLTEKETVVIYLSKYQLDSVPSEVGRLKKAKRLFITADSGGWTIYPPLSALPQPTNSSLGQNLPDEITELTNLKSLGLVHLNLTSLPRDFIRLKNLDSLDLSMNRLVISDEIPKLKELKGLKYLGLLGNKIDSTDIEELKRGNPKLTIQTWIE
jgi:Leucine-rich repeat (LRR) protein